MMYRSPAAAAAASLRDFECVVDSRSPRAPILRDFECVVDSRSLRAPILRQRTAAREVLRERA
jgi:hypothetical protein